MRVFCGRCGVETPGTLAWSGGTILLRVAFPTPSVRISLPEAIVFSGSLSLGSPPSVLIRRGDLVWDGLFVYQ